MNAPPNIGLVTAPSDNDVVQWLMNDTRDERFIDNILQSCVFGSSERASPSSERRFIF